MWVRVSGQVKIGRIGHNSTEKLPLSATCFDPERSGMREHFVLPRPRVSLPFDPARNAAGGSTDLKLSLWSGLAGGAERPKWAARTIIETLPRSATGVGIDRSGMREHFVLPLSLVSLLFDPEKERRPGARLT